MRENKEERNGICDTSSEQQYTSGSRTRATIALSPEEPELVQQHYSSNFIKEAFGVRTNIRIHADSSAAKNHDARRYIKKANHIQLRDSQQAHVHSWRVRPSQQFHISKYSSQHSLLNNSCTGHLSLSTTNVKVLQLSFT